MDFGRGQDVFLVGIRQCVCLCSLVCVFVSVLFSFCSRKMKLGSGVVPTLFSFENLESGLSGFKIWVLGYVHLCVVLLDASLNLDSTRPVSSDVARKIYVHRRSVFTIVIVYRALRTLFVAVAFRAVDGFLYFSRLFIPQSALRLDFQDLCDSVLLRFVYVWWPERDLAC